MTLNPSAHLGNCLR